MAEQADGTPRRTAERCTRTGVGFNLAARLLWGIASWVISLSRSQEVLRVFEQRLLWSFAFTASALLLAGQGVAVTRLCRNRTLGIVTILSAAVIGSNWLVVIWCVKHEQLASASLGFLAAPILTVAGGVVLLGERRSPAVMISVLVCACGIAVWFGQGEIRPWAACYVAVSSATYAVLRKRFSLPALVAGTAETGLALAATTCLLVLEGGPAALAPPEIDGLGYSIVLGLSTTLPMILYVHSLRSIPVSVAGYLQYVTPTTMLAVAFFLLDEPIAPERIAGLSLIWLSVAIFLASASLERRLHRVRTTEATTP